MTQGSRPLFIFDGDCGFCRRWVRYWKARARGRVDFEPYQEAAARFPDIPRERFSRASFLIEPGRVSSAARAVFGLTACAPLGGAALWLYERVPPFAWASELGYRFIARHRALAARVTRWLWGDDVGPHQVYGVRWLFLRALGLIYLDAFLSLGVQVRGLLGENGILPAARLLPAARRALGARAYAMLPSLFWLTGASDRALSALCWSGAALAVLVVLDAAPGPSLLLCWASYLSLVNVGRDFLGFQWDVLLLEAGFLAIFFAPWRLRPRLREDPPPSTAFLWLLRLLLLRLMLESGLVKLSSGDPTWRHLTALFYHYQTQPLPTWIGWHAQQLAAWFQRASVGLVFFIELLVPLLILLPRRPRAFACGAFLFLQLLIALTGNYGFFNFLAAALCLTLLDDGALRRRLPAPLARRLTFAPAPRRTWRTAAAVPVGAYVALASFLQFARFFPGRVPLEGAVASALEAVDGFHLSSPYGLFAVMTTRRMEISVQGSDDGIAWKEYRFKWKPGDPARRPAFVEPHMPRLDWQMWFAALGSYRDSPWYFNFVARLLQGSPQVLTLLADNPFPDHPPRYIRSLAYDYRFTTRAERRATGDWWHRDLEGMFAPVVGRKE